MIELNKDRDTQDGNGVKTSFDFDFFIQKNTDIKVYIINKTTGVKTLKSLTTHYSVSNIKTGKTIGFTVTMVTAPTSNEQIFVLQEIPCTQTIDLEAVTDFDERKMMGALDKITAVCQRMQGSLDRTLKTADESDVTSLVLPVFEAGKVLAVNETEDGLTLVDVELGLLQGYVDDAEASATAAAGSASIAQAAAGVVPAPVATNYLRQNAAGNGLEYRTPAQVKSDLAVAWDDVLSKPDVLIRPGISYVSRNGYNNCFMLIDGVLYSTSGAVSRDQYLTGRGYDTNPFLGVSNFKKVPIPSSSPIVKAGGGYNGTVAWALLANKELYTWGYNPEGQCGLGHTTRVDIPTLAATDVEDVYDHTSNGIENINYGRLFIKKSDGYIYGTGYNVYGQLGLGDTTNRTSFTKITALGTDVANVFSLGGGYGCTIVQKTNGTILACGYNGEGQLGIGNTTSQSNFVDITVAWGGGAGYAIKQCTYGSNYYGHASGGINALGILLDNNTTTVFKMSGYNGYGQLGDGTVTARNTPVTPNVGAGRISKIAGMCVGVHTVKCLKEDGNLYAWGYNAYGAVGDGTTTNRDTPTIVASNVTDIYSDGLHSYNGTQASSYIKKADGLYACGYNGQGQCGLGHVTTPVTSYTKMLFPVGISIKLFGCFYTTTDGNVLIAIDTNNKGYVWGYNAQNGITPGSVLNVLVPTKFTITGEN